MFCTSRALLCRFEAAEQMLKVFALCFTWIWVDDEPHYIRGGGLQIQLIV